MAERTARTCLFCLIRFRRIRQMHRAQSPVERMPTEKAIRRLLVSFFSSFFCSSSVPVHALNVLSGQTKSCAFLNVSYVQPRQCVCVSGWFVICLFFCIINLFTFIENLFVSLRESRPQCMPNNTQRNSLVTRNNNQEINLTHTRTSHNALKFKLFIYALSDSAAQTMDSPQFVHFLSNPVSAMSTTHPTHCWLPLGCRECRATPVPFPMHLFNCFAAHFVKFKILTKCQHNKFRGHLFSPSPPPPHRPVIAIFEFEYFLLYTLNQD